MLLYRDHGRYAELIAAINADWISKQRSIEGGHGDSPLPNRTPSLVSFVGQTGAGKSTLIKLMIQLKSPPGLDTDIYPSPVVGVPGEELPTSEDVHLYVDPSTSATETPLLYADCEGLDAERGNHWRFRSAKSEKAWWILARTHPFMASTAPRGNCSG